MVFIAGDFEASEILCNLPPHTLRVNLQSRRWFSDVDSEQAITDSNDNGIPIEFVLLGFTPFFGNLGMRTTEEFIRIAYIGVTPKHRLLPPRCVTTTIISGKTSQKNFIGYFQNLFNNRINCASVITSTKFVQKSFNEKDPTTGMDGNKINYNCIEFNDRPPASKDETVLLEDISKWLSSNTDTLTSALRSHIPGSNLVELPFGEDHKAIKDQFIASMKNDGTLEGLGDVPRIAEGQKEESRPPVPTAEGQSRKKAPTQEELQAAWEAKQKETSGGAAVDF
jgi:hypothetical protein